MISMNKNRLLRIFVYLRKDMSDPYYQNIAPGLAYYFLMSLVPIFILFGQFSGLFSLGIESIVPLLETYLPEEAADFILPMLTTPISKGGFIANIVFLISTLYLASRAMYALVKISDQAYRIPPPDVKLPWLVRFVKQHLKAIVLTFCLLIIIIFALLIIVFSGVIFDFLLDNFLPENPLFLHIRSLWNLLVIPLSFFLFFGMLLAIYWGMPSKRVPVKQMVPGALFAALGIVVASAAYLFYLRNFANYNLIYGALANIVILLLWFFIIGYILEFGILLNSAVKKSRR